MRNRVKIQLKSPNPSDFDEARFAVPSEVVDLNSAGQLPQLLHQLVVTVNPPAPAGKVMSQLHLQLLVIGNDAAVRLGADVRVALHDAVQHLC